jgi:transcriptional regulator with XRE-family HTH domain
MLSTSEAPLLVSLMTHDEQQFFKELGARIAQLRKEAGLSQQAVADSLEIAQQTYANYEVARARPSVSMLPTLAQLFGVSVDELLGLNRGGAGRRPNTAPAEADRAAHTPAEVPAAGRDADARWCAEPVKPLSGSGG